VWKWVLGGRVLGRGRSRWDDEGGGRWWWAVGGDPGGRALGWRVVREVEGGGRTVWVGGRSLWGVVRFGYIQPRDQHSYFFSR
jgi:hypothetical protein